MTAYYNEFDPDAAAWLRELIADGLIAPGDVDERSIIDVSAKDIKGYGQCHWFAGIGGWSYALRLAQWPDDAAVWTASLPCQPFSTAGKGLGKQDERHLLPHFLELVKKCKPDTIFGEQVERAIGHGWLDDLQATVEAETYAVGHCVLVHTASARRTSDNGCTGWWTPKANESEENVDAVIARRERLRMEGDMKTGNLLNLSQEAQLAGWVSPTAQDHSRGSKPPRPHDTGIPLSQQVALIGSTVETTNTGQLNPGLSRWLTGFPWNGA